ncbi:MAG: enolase C-terminal domain-like protein [Gammaproteobacteria bacterium]
MSNSPLIARIELLMFEIQVANVGTDRAGLGVRYTPGPGDVQVRMAVRVHTDAGIIGEYIPPRGRAKVVQAASEALAYGLIGQPALERERHYSAMRRATKHIGEVGIGPLDVALWDVAGKFQNVSIAQMLGGHRTRLPSYASTLGGDRVADGLSSPAAYADYAEQCFELGYRAYKMHGWSRGDVEEESAMIRTVSERMSGRMAIMYDAACHLGTLADAIHVGRVCDAHELYWYEDPYADGGISLHAHRQLKRHVRTPILIGEHVRNPEAKADMMVAGVTDFARVDPDYDGGLTGCYKAALAAEALGLDVEVHSCGPAMRQLMAGLRSSNYYEINLVHPRIGNAWALPVYADGYSDDVDAVDADGCVPVPSGPGLGVTYDWERVEARLLERRVIE